VNRCVKTSESERSYGFLHAVKEEGNDVLADDNVQLLHVLPGAVVWSSVWFMCDVRRKKKAQKNEEERRRTKEDVEPIVVEVFMDAQVAQKRKVGVVKLDMTHTTANDMHAHTT